MPHSWFLAQLKPNAQKIALRNLTRQGFETFLPLIDQTTRRGSRFVTAQKPLFPGYIFVAFDTSQGGWRAINATMGVTRLVSFTNTPAEVPADLIEGLRARCGDDGLLLPEPELTPGDAVQITSGPFAQFVATVDKIDAEKRVWVLLDLMGRQTRLAVSPDALRPD